MDLRFPCVDLMEENNYGGSKFEYVEKLGSVYDLPGDKGSIMKQTGHILRRIARMIP